MVVVVAVAAVLLSLGCGHSKTAAVIYPKD